MKYVLKIVTTLFPTNTLCGVDKMHFLEQLMTFQSEY